MHDIVDGQLQITNLSRVEQVRLPESHRTCRRRAWDSFCYVLAGKVDYHMADGRNFTLHAGDVQYLPFGCNYTMDIHPEGFHYIVCDFVCPVQEERKDFSFSARNQQVYEKLFRELALRFSTGTCDCMASSMAVLFQIYAQIVKDHHPGYLSGSAKRKIVKAQMYIQQNLTDRNLSVQQLADQAQMSQVHFRRLFYELFGMPPVKYLLNARVEKAKSLLGLSEMRLEDVARQTGFSSTAHLCAAFKNTTGLTPGQYRKNI